MGFFTFSKCSQKLVKRLLTGYFQHEIMIKVASHFQSPKGTSTILQYQRKEDSSNGLHILQKMDMRVTSVTPLGLVSSQQLSFPFCLHVCYCLHQNQSTTSHFDSSSLRNFSRDLCIGEEQFYYSPSSSNEVWSLKEVGKSVWILTQING